MAVPPEPGDWRQLAIQVARLLSRPLDPNRPLWEMYIIEGLDRVADLPPGAFAILLKIHHAMIDGMGALALLSGMLEFASQAPPQSGPSKWRPDAGPTTTEMLTRGWLKSLLRPGKLAARTSAMGGKAIRQRFAGAADQPALAGGSRPWRTCFCPSRRG